MTIVSCEVHGLVGGQPCCAHVGDAILAQRPEAAQVLMDSWGASILLCDECMRKGVAQTECRRKWFDYELDLGVPVQPYCVEHAEDWFSSTGQGLLSEARNSARGRAPREGVRMIRYHVTHADGVIEHEFPVEKFSELLDELPTASGVDPYVAVTHESGWIVKVPRSGFLMLENWDMREPMYLEPVSSAMPLALMRAAAEGRSDELERAPWIPGYSPAPTG